jgi:hypothetical protein
MRNQEANTENNFKMVRADLYSNISDFKKEGGTCFVFRIPIQKVLDLFSIYHTIRGHGVNILNLLECYDPIAKSPLRKKTINQTKRKIQKEIQELSQYSRTAEFVLNSYLWSTRNDADVQLAITDAFLASSEQKSRKNILIKESSISILLENSELVVFGPDDRRMSLKDVDYETPVFSSYDFFLNGEL